VRLSILARPRHMTWDTRPTSDDKWGGRMSQIPERPVAIVAGYEASLAGRGFLLGLHFYDLSRYFGCGRYKPQ